MKSAEDLEFRAAEQFDMAVRKPAPERKKRRTAAKRLIAKAMSIRRVGKEYFARASRISVHTDPNLWPVVLTLSETAILTRQSAQGLYRRVQKGTAQPMPVLVRGLVAKPIRFHRDAVKAYVEGA